MKKKVLAGLLASVSLMSLFVGSTGAFAAGGAGDTEVTVGFTNHDPGTGDGDLEILHKASTFDFGNTNAIDKKSFSTSSPNYVVVKDDRGVNVANTWKLTAELSALKDDTSRVLTGAGLTFTTGVMGFDESKASPESPDAIIPKGSRTAKEFALASGGLVAGGAAQTVMTDGDGSTTGTFKGATALEVDTITLTAPGTSAIAGAEYKGKVTWSLTDAL